MENTAMNFNENILRNKAHVEKKTPSRQKNTQKTLTNYDQNLFQNQSHNQSFVTDADNSYMLSQDTSLNKSDYNKDNDGAGNEVCTFDMHTRFTMIILQYLCLIYNFSFFFFRRNAM